RGAGDVVHAGLVEEVDGGRVAAVFPAHADLQVRPGPAAALDGRAHQGTDAFGVDRAERRGGEDAVLQVGGEERALRVVAAHAPGGLGQVVGTEGEELGVLGDPARGQR